MKDKEPCKYYPFKDGTYEVGMGLHSIETDFGNGDRDQLIFQYDNESDYLREHRFDLGVDFIGDRFTQGQSNVLKDFIFKNIVKANYFKKNELPDKDFSLKLLSHYFPEDIVLVTIDEDKKEDYISAMQVTAPSGWDPEVVINQSFFEIHKDIPGMKELSKRGYQITKNLIVKNKQYVRFIWSFSYDNEISHNPKTWTRKTFDPQEGNLWIRVERQTITPLPKIKSYIFTIRPYIYPILKIALDSVEYISGLLEAMDSMLEEDRLWRCPDGEFDDIYQYLQGIKGMS